MSEVKDTECLYKKEEYQYKLCEYVNGKFYVFIAEDGELFKNYQLSNGFKDFRTEEDVITDMYDIYCDGVFYKRVELKKIE